jgi:ATP-dependent HslUV protease ATP-binding subunit HslU
MLPAEVGFHGRDVDQIIRDLLDNAVMLVKSKLRRQQTEEVARAVEDRILEALVGSGPGTQASTRVC